MKLLVDGDIVVYRCAFAAENTKYVLTDTEGNPVAGPFVSAAERKQWIDDTNPDVELVSNSYKEYEPLSHALANVKSVMARISEVGELTGVFLSSGENFRHRLATKKYKGNRDDAIRPKYYAEVRKYLIDYYGALTFESIEADDALAMCQKDDTAIVSIDKDLLQVPGYHYDWVKGDKMYISPEVGLRKLWLQVLTGDGTDNIPGIRGVGPVKARKLLADVPDEGLAQACLNIWTEYLESGIKLPLDDMSFTKGRGVIPEDILEERDCVAYIPWFADSSDDVILSSPEEVMHEVYNLVKVGGEHAEKAAEDAGEAVLLPR